MIKRSQSTGGAMPPAPGWGVVADVTARVAAVRFEWADRSLSCPYAAFTRWEWTRSEPETLVITTRKERIVLSGRGLETVRDALDSGKLQVVRAQGERHAAVAGGTWIEAIKIEAQ